MPISAAEYLRRRRRLLRKAGRGAAVIVAGGEEVVRSNDTHYPFRQDSYFRYLTGIGEPDCVLVMTSDDDGDVSTVFCRPRDPERERWEGPRLGQEGVVERYAINSAESIHDIGEWIPKLLRGKRRLYYCVGQSPAWDERIIRWIKAVGKDAGAPTELIDVRPMLNEMRIKKSRSEIAMMRRSADVAMRAHRRAMRATCAGRAEYQIAAELGHEFGSAGASHAYLPIVASGSNACVLHYVANVDLLHDGDLLLIDAGAELNGYASDVTRTFPISGRYTSPQKDVYEIVLAAQTAAVDAVAPGVPIDLPHRRAVRIIAEGLKTLGLIDTSVDECVETESYRRYYMHKTSHWIGLDVHDVGDYRMDGNWRPLKAGMVLTVEPGIYVDADEQSAPKALRGIGIRIEDDVLVTGKGRDVLTASLEKTPDAIEALMANG